MVVNDDPGLKAFLASSASPEAKVERYLVLETRSRFDVYPPFNAVPTGTHSAVLVPDRPAQVRGNTKGRPGLRLDQRRELRLPAELCADGLGRAGGLPRHGRCLRDSRQRARQLPAAGDHRAGRGHAPAPIPQQNHNPTVFKDLVFTTWYGHGLRVIDISNPMTPREVGYALPVPQGIARTYPVFKDGLMYWADNRTGLHVAKYTGPYANEIPDQGCLRRQRHEPAPLNESESPSIDPQACWPALWPAPDSSGRQRELSSRPALQDPPDEEIAWVCPMHPAYTSTAAGSCPICGMVLIQTRPYDTRDFRLVFRTEPAQLSAPGRRLTLFFTFLRPGSDEVVKDFEVVHTKRFHLFIVSQDLEFFEHIHPVMRPDGTWTIETTVPKAGYYQVLCDFMPSGGTGQFLTAPLVTAGYAGDLATDSARLCARQHASARARATSPRRVVRSAAADSRASTCISTSI